MAYTPSGLWVLDLRPQSNEEQMLTREMKNYLRTMNNIYKKNIAVQGPSGSGKTLLAESLGRFKTRTLNLSKEIPKDFDSIHKNNEILILKRIDEAPDKFLKKMSNYSKYNSVFVTSRNTDYFTKPYFDNFAKISIETMLPKSNRSFDALEKYLVNILKVKNISFDAKDEQFQISIKELFEKLWPNLRQIIRQLQLRTKTGQWVSIPL